jgi:hypothetical protein
MSSLAKPTLDNKAQLADTFAKSSTTKLSKVNKIFHAPEGYRRLTINLREDIHKKIRMKAVEEDCTVTDIITRLLEKEVR